MRYQKCKFLLLVSGVIRPGTESLWARSAGNAIVTAGRHGGTMNSKPPEVLIVRAWLELAAHPRLRIRIVAVRPGQPERHVLTSTSVNTACDAVRDWLTSLELQNPGGPVIPR